MNIFVFTKVLVRGMPVLPAVADQTVLPTSIELPLLTFTRLVPSTRIFAAILPPISLSVTTLSALVVIVEPGARPVKYIFEGLTDRYITLPTCTLATTLPELVANTSIPKTAKEKIAIIPNAIKTFQLCASIQSPELV